MVADYPATTGDDGRAHPEHRKAQLGDGQEHGHRAVGAVIREQHDVLVLAFRRCQYPVFTGLSRVPWLRLDGAIVLGGAHRVIALAVGCTQDVGGLFWSNVPHRAAVDRALCAVRLQPAVAVRHGIVVGQADTMAMALHSSFSHLSVVTSLRT